MTTPEPARPYVSVRFRLRWTECDPAGIAYYPRFFELMEVSAHVLSRELGITREDMLHPRLLGLTPVASQANFLAPALLEDDLEVRTRVTRIGTTSLGLRHEIVRLAPGPETVLVRAREERVYVGRDGTSAMRPRPLTPPMRTVLSHYLVEPESEEA